jgi:uncharacterized protein (TIGR03086 family)
MSEICERYNKVAGQFTARVDAVTEGAWDNPAPCAGWVARDVVRHLVEWIPSFPLAKAGIDAPTPDDDPARAWHGLDTVIRSALEDAAIAARELDTPMGPVRLEQAIDMFCIPDILVHTWDLARATGLAETLDPDEVHRLLERMEPMDEALRQSGHYGPRVEVPDDADEQTRLIAFTGRRP